MKQSGSGIGYFSGRRYVPTGQEGDGLGDFFRAAKPALMGFARRAGNSVLSAGATVLKDEIEGKNGESAKNAFSEVGMSFLNDTVSKANGKKRRVPGAQTGKPKKAETLPQHLQLICKTLVTPVPSSHPPSTARH